MPVTEGAHAAEFLSEVASPRPLIDRTSAKNAAILTRQRAYAENKDKFRIIQSDTGIQCHI